LRQVVVRTSAQTATLAGSWQLPGAVGRWSLYITTSKLQKKIY